MNPQIPDNQTPIQPVPLPKANFPWPLLIVGVLILVVILLFIFSYQKKTASQSASNIPYSQTKQVHPSLKLGLVTLVQNTVSTIPSTVSLNLDTNGNLLKNMQVTISYDPQILQHVSFYPSSLLVGSVFSQDTSSTAEGSLTIHTVLPDATISPNGNGLLGYFFFSLNPKRSLNLQETKISLQNGRYITKTASTSLSIDSNDVTIPLLTPIQQMITNNIPAAKQTPVHICPVGTSSYFCSNMPCGNDTNSISNENLYCTPADQPYCCQLQSKTKLENIHDVTDDTCIADGGICAPGGSICGTGNQITTCSYNRPCCKNPHIPTPTPISTDQSTLYCAQHNLGAGGGKCKASCDSGSETQVSTCTNNQPCCVPNPTINSACPKTDEFCYIPASANPTPDSQNSHDMCKINGKTYSCYPTF